MGNKTRNLKILKKKFNNGEIINKNNIKPTIKTN
jgi:hypothetical protein